MKQENSENITAEDITLEFVTNNENIKMTDINNANDLSMYCYTNCDDNSNNLVKKTRGIVFNKDKIIVRSLGFTSDYTIHNKEILLNRKLFKIGTKELYINTSNYHFEICIDKYNNYIFCYS